jgi:hypothetical protein
MTLNCSLDFNSNHHHGGANSHNESVIRHSSHQAWSAYGVDPVGGGTGIGGGQAAGSFDATPYNTQMSHQHAAAAASYYTASLNAAAADTRRDVDRKHGIPFWPNDYSKYSTGGGVGSISDCQAFGAAQSWCASAYAPYAARVPSHVGGDHSQSVSYLTAAAAAAADDRRSAAVAAIDQHASSFHDTYGLRNAYCSPDPMSGTPYPPPGKINFYFLTCGLFALRNSNFYYKLSFH